MENLCTIKRLKTQGRHCKALIVFTLITFQFPTSQQVQRRIPMLYKSRTSHLTTEIPNHYLDGNLSICLGWRGLRGRSLCPRTTTLRAVSRKQSKQFPIYSLRCSLPVCIGIQCILCEQDCG